LRRLRSFLLDAFRRDYVISGSPRTFTFTNKKVQSCGASVLFAKCLQTRLRHLRLSSDVHLYKQKGSVLWRLRLCLLVSKTRLTPSPALLGFGPCSNKLWTCHPVAPTSFQCSCHKAPYRLQAQASPPDFCQDRRFASIVLTERAAFLVVPMGPFFKGSFLWFFIVFSYYYKFYLIILKIYVFFFYFLRLFWGSASFFLGSMSPNLPLNIRWIWLRKNHQKSSKKGRFLCLFDNFFAGLTIFVKGQQKMSKNPKKVVKKEVVSFLADSPNT
jgi:hypothetical protein